MINQKAFFNNWEEFYQRYVLVFNLIVVITLVPFGWMYLQLESGSFEPYFEDDQLRWLGAVVLFFVAAAGLYRSYATYRDRIAGINKGIPVKHKLLTYYNIQINKFIRYELIAIVALAGMLLFQPVIFAIFYIFILFVFSLDWPKYTKVVEHLRLTKDEQALLEAKEPLPD